MVTCYVFHEENRHNYPMNTEISMNWCRGYYDLVYKDNEKYITEEVFNRIAANCLAGHNIEAKGIVPSMSLREFMEEVKKPMEHLPNEETCGATPAGYIPPITSSDWPVTINDYFDDVEPPLDVDSDTNHSRYGGMKQAIGLQLDESDYDMTYDGTAGSESIVVTKNNTEDDTKDTSTSCSRCGNCIALDDSDDTISYRDSSITDTDSIYTSSSDDPFSTHYEP